MNNESASNLIFNVTAIKNNDAVAHRLGEKLADALYLKRDKEHKDRWLTEWGTKTNIGLARTVIRMIKES